jgi:Na+/proline symporter
VIQGARGLYDYLQGIQAYLAPPIFVVFFFGVFMKRLNGPGCLATLLTGFAMGLFRLIVDTPVKLGGDAYTEGSFLWVVNNIFFQYYSLLITIVCILVFIIVSFATRPPGLCEDQRTYIFYIIRTRQAGKPFDLELEGCSAFGVTDCVYRSDLYVFHGMTV